MTATTPRKSFVLAVHPNSTGLGYVVFEGPFAPFDWGTLQPRREKNARCLRRIERLIERLQPEFLILEAVGVAPQESRNRVARLRAGLVNLALQNEIEVSLLSRGDVQGCFANVGAKTRQEIAEAVARQVPALARRIPKPRRPWETENPRIAMFTAAALALTHYALGAKRFLDSL